MTKRATESHESEINDLVVIRNNDFYKYTHTLSEELRGVSKKFSEIYKGNKVVFIRKTTVAAYLIHTNQGAEVQFNPSNQRISLISGSLYPLSSIKQILTELYGSVIYDDYVIVRDSIQYSEKKRIVNFASREVKVLYHFKKNDLLNEMINICEEEKTDVIKSLKSQVRDDLRDRLVHESVKQEIIQQCYLYIDSISFHQIMNKDLRSILLRKVDSMLDISELTVSETLKINENDRLTKKSLTSIEKNLKEENGSINQYLSSYDELHNLSTTISDLTTEFTKRVQTDNKNHLGAVKILIKTGIFLNDLNLSKHLAVSSSDSSRIINYYETAKDIGSTISDEDFVSAYSFSLLKKHA